MPCIACVADPAMPWLVGWPVIRFLKLRKSSATSRRVVCVSWFSAWPTLPPGGAYSSRRRTVVWPLPSGVKLTVPALYEPLVLRHEMRWFGTFSVTLVVPTPA